MKQLMDELLGMNININVLLELVDLEISKLELEKESIETKIKGLRGDRFTLVKAVVDHQLQNNINEEV